MTPLQAALAIVGVFGAMTLYKRSREPKTNPEFFTDKVGGVHPIRHGEGVHESSGGRYSERVRKQIDAKGTPATKKAGRRGDFDPGILSEAERVYAQHESARDPKAVKMFGQPKGIAGASKIDIAKWLQNIRTVENETGVSLDASKIRYGTDMAGIRAEAAAKKKAYNKRAGIRALTKKYGKDSAARIVKDFSGKSMIGSTPEMLAINTPARRAAQDRRLAALAARKH